MIPVPPGVRVLLATRPVDFRKGAHGLAALAAEVLVWKQLQQGAFRWPPLMDGVMKLSAVEFAALFDGLDWMRVQPLRRIPQPTAAA